jgi:hypothetical protein
MSVRITTLNENTIGMVNLLANSIMPVPVSISGKGLPFRGLYFFVKDLSKLA